MLSENRGLKMRTVFLSYCSKDKEIADIVENGLLTRLGERIIISRYTRNVQYRDSFKSFMDTIRAHDFVVAIVSDSFLRSNGCLYEISEVLKEKDYTERLHFIVLQDGDEKYYSHCSFAVAAKIFSILDQADYLYSWQDRINEAERKIAGIDEDAALDAKEELKKARKIKNYDLPFFMRYLSDHKVARLSKLIETDFEDIVVRICPDAKDIIGSFTTYNDLFFSAIEAISSITHTDYNQIILLAKTESHNFGLVVFADKIGGNKQKYRLVATDGIISHTYALKETVYIEDVLSNNSYFRAVPNTRSELAIPIRVKGEVVGVVNSESEVPYYYTANMIRRVEYLTGKIAMQLQRIGYRCDLDVNTMPYISLNVEGEK